jgi:hypothetical protein
VQVLIGVEPVRMSIADEPEYRLGDARFDTDDHHP